MINPLEALILKTLKHNPVSNAELYEIVVRAGFLPKHGVEVLTALQKAGSLHIAPAGTRAGSFFLNYQATHGADRAKHRRIKLSLI
jgi:hypothetical protein